MIGIYKITNPKGNVYIGQSVNIEKRFLDYKYKLAFDQPKLNRSFIKYGFENHKFETIHECEASDLNDIERYYQEIYNCIGNGGLNLCYVKSSDKNGFHSEETKRKISLNNARHRLGTKLSVEQKQHLREINLGKKLSEETKAKISNSNKGKVVVISEETKEKLRQHNLGNKASEVTKKKMRKSQLNISEESKRRRRDGIIKFHKENPSHRKGLIHSEETKRKMSESGSKLIIVDLKTGVFFFSITECAIAYGMLNCTMHRQLTGFSKNKTNLKII